MSNDVAGTCAGLRQRIGPYSLNFRRVAKRELHRSVSDTRRDAPVRHWCARRSASAVMHRLGPALVPSSLVNSFSDPDNHGAAVHATTGADLTITGRGQFATTLTRIRLHQLWMQRFYETLPRVADVTVVAGRAVVIFRTEPGPALLWDGMEVHQTNIVRLSEGQPSIAQPGRLLISPCLCRSR